MYFPTPEVDQVNAEPWWLETDQQRLKIWRITSHESATGPAIIYFGGNAEAVENNIQDYRRMFPGYTIYITNYRGYGGSSGQPTEQALFSDAITIFDNVKQQHSSVDIIGRSLGSGVACYVAAQREVQKLALITPYDSIKNVAQSAYPTFPVKWLLKDHFDSVSYSPAISSDILILIVSSDQVVPNSGTEHLIQALSHNPVQVERYSNVTHAGVSDSMEYQKKLSGFFNKSS